MTAAFDRAQWRRIADGLAAAVVAAIPWSTSLTYILIAAWLLVLIPTTERDEWREVLRHPAAWLPLALVALALVGMTWASGVSWPDRLKGFTSFARLLAIIALFVQFRDSSRVKWVFGAFLLSCSLVLIASALMVFAGMGPLSGGSTSYGVPVRDYIVQSQEFILCAMGLIYIAYLRARERDWTWAIASGLLAALFLINVVFIASSRTGLVTVPVLLLILVTAHCRRLVSLAIGCVVIAVAVAAFFMSPTVRDRLSAVITEVQDARERQIATSAGQRVDFWLTSIDIIRKAPLLGNGTGSIHHAFIQAAKESGSNNPPTTNPHNQTLAVAIQLGIAGAFILIAMWASHALLFRYGGLAGWIGLAAVAQNVIGSLFNSHLFDFAQSWIYVFGVGVAGAAMLSQGREAARVPAPQAVET